MSCYYIGRTTNGNNDKNLWTNYFWGSFPCILLNGVNICFANIVDALPLTTMINVYGSSLIFLDADQGPPLLCYCYSSGTEECSAKVVLETGLAKPHTRQETLKKKGIFYIDYIHVPYTSYLRYLQLNNKDIHIFISVYI